MSGFINGNSPLRLLREKWDSASALAQELYAMTQSKGPVELNNTLTIRVPENTPALKIERQQAGDTFDLGQRNSLTKQQIAAAARNQVETNAGGPRGRTVEPRRVAAGVVGEGPRPQQAPTQLDATPTTKFRQRPPLIEVGGGVSFTGNDPVTFSRSPVIPDPQTGLPTDVATLATRAATNAVAASAAAQTFMGKVVGPDPETDGTFLVALYKTGPAGSASSPVKVVIPQLAAKEVIPKDTWIAPIYKFGAKYYCQVPVWLE